MAIQSQNFSFGIVENAQSRWDFEVLADRNRRALCVHLGVDVKRDLLTLENLFKKIWDNPFIILL